jgi:hypothetical protein
LKPNIVICSDVNHLIDSIIEILIYNINCITSNTIMSGVRRM